MSRSRLLIVDDDAAILRLVERMVAERAAALTAGTVNEALQALEHHPNVNVVVTDYDMPERSGLELLEWLARHRPAVRRVLMSASQLHLLARGGLCDALLQKPFSLGEVRDAVFGPSMLAAGKAWRMVLEGGLLRVDWLAPPEPDDIELELQAEERVLSLGARHVRLTNLGLGAAVVLGSLRPLAKWWMRNARPISRLCVAAAYVSSTSFGRLSAEAAGTVLYHGIPVRTFSHDREALVWLQGQARVVA